MKTRLLLLAFAIVAAAAAFAHPPVSVVIDRQGNAYYSDLQHVWRVAPDGKKTVVVPNVHTHELYLDGQGNLYGEQSWYSGERTNKWGHYVWRRSPDGKMTKVIPDRAGFLEDYSFVRDAAGNMYLGDPDRKRVMVIPAGGKGLERQPVVLASGFEHISWMTASPDGTVYFVSAGDLVRMTPNRVVKRVAKIGSGRRHAVMGLWTDRAGNVYVAIHNERAVKKVTRDGKVTIFTRSPGTWAPVGGAFAANGDLMLLECSPDNEVRLRRVKK